MTCKPGETVRIECADCGEFDVCLEPKCKRDPKSAKGMKPCEVDYCPCCGKRLATEEESDDSDG